MHFVNALGRSPLDEVAPVADIEVVLRFLPCAKASALLASRRLDLRYERGTVQFVLPGSRHTSGRGSGDVRVCSRDVAQGDSQRL